MSDILFIFLQDEEQDVFKRDFSAPTLEDHFNKTILPKVMQVSTKTMYFKPVLLGSAQIACYSPYSHTHPLSYYN